MKLVDQVSNIPVGQIELDNRDVHPAAIHTGAALGERPGLRDYLELRVILLQQQCEALSGRCGEGDDAASTRLTVVAL